MESYLFSTSFKWGEKKYHERILLVLAVLVGCAENKKLDEQLPEIKVTESKVIT